MKSRSYFFDEGIQELIRNNLKTNKAAADKAARFVSDTEYWLNLDYKELKTLMFSSELKRSWFVLSDGYCPVCNQSVPMYNWQHDAKNVPWKMKCPHCSTLFPSNDFKAYYESGLDKRGRFKHENADKSLLVSSDGGKVIDDGNGWYDPDGKRYMFIGAYLSHALFDKVIKEGIFRLGFSYVLTNNKEYALRAAVLLDAVAQFWPEFDFFTQGLMYEQEFKSNGYVNYWVNSNRDVRLFALAYDQIFSFIRNNDEIESIIGKSSESICNGIEERILRDSLTNEHKINTNPPETPLTVAITRAVLDYDTDSNDIHKYIDNLIEEAIRIDGLSGESGIAGYAAISPRAISDLLCLFSNMNDKILYQILERHPKLFKTYRFHIDTWYDAKYYPGVGDSSVFGMPLKNYTALFSEYNPLSTVYFRSREWFIMELSKYFDEPDFAKTIYHSNNRSIKGAFNNDFYLKDTHEYEMELEKIIDSTGEFFEWKSVNYDEWRISLLHTGAGNNKAMLAMPYSSGANHCHHDALSLHLFAKSLNFTADFGYPPVNYGGWETKEANWYKQPSAHNTVVIDKKMHINLPPSGDGMFYRYPEFGRNIFMIDSDFIHATYNEAKEYADAERFERCSMLVDISEEDCYCLDIFRVSGGTEHARFQRTSYSDIEYKGLSLSPGQDYDSEKTIMRNFMTDESPEPGWSVDFSIHDELNVLETPKELHLRYIPLTPAVTVTLCESWVDITKMTQADKEKTGNREVWIPTLIEKTTGGTTQFTGILEPYESKPFITSAKKLKTDSKTALTEAVRITHSDNITDIVILNNPESPEIINLIEHGISTDALLTIVRFKGQSIEKAILIKGTYLDVEAIRMSAENNTGSVIFI